ncbi:MAG TPA: hypothetical protein VFK33_12180 [Bacillales bacterium]|nr:hypothetical protein [Bacillales bacterium]
MSVAIRFNQAVLNAAADDAGILNGVNQGFGYSSHLKSSRGITVSGSKSLTNENFNAVYDNDFMDTPINDCDYTDGRMAGS